MRDFVEGFLKFQREAFPERSELFQRLATTQNSTTLFITCSGSRVVPELLRQREPGDLFVIRNAGNIVPTHGHESGGVTARVKYAVVALGATDVVVCGHSDCEAMTAIASCKCLDNMPPVAAWLRYADAARAVNAAQDFRDPKARLRALVRENVIAQVANLPPINRLSCAAGPPHSARMGLRHRIRRHRGVGWRLGVVPIPVHAPGNVCNADMRTRRAGSSGKQIVRGSHHDWSASLRLRNAATLWRFPQSAMLHQRRRWERVRS